MNYLERLYRNGQESLARIDSRCQINPALEALDWHIPSVKYDQDKQ